MNYKDVLIRAAKTFVQAFLATLATAVAGVTDIDTARAALIGAGAAGVAAVWNLILSYKSGK